MVEPHPVNGGNDGEVAAAGIEPPRIRWDAIVGAAAIRMPHIDASLRNLSRQSALAAPAKLALSPAGTAVILAEAPAWDDRDRSAAAIRSALGAAVLWVNHDGASAVAEPVAGNGPATEAEESCLGWIEGALEGLEWTWERGERRAFRVMATSAGVTAQIEPAAAAGAVRVRHDTRPLRVSAPGVESALRLFALEVNARFRFARLSVGRPGNGAAPDVVSVAWDAVVLAGPGGVRWLADAVEALWVADAETRRALRALTNATVAEAYLAARDPRRRRSAGGSPAVTVR